MKTLGALAGLIVGVLVYGLFTDNSTVPALMKGVIIGVSVLLVLFLSAMAVIMNPTNNTETKEVIEYSKMHYSKPQAGKYVNAMWKELRRLGKDDFASGSQGKRPDDHLIFIPTGDGVLLIGNPPQEALVVGVLRRIGKDKRALRFYVQLPLDKDGNVDKEQPARLFLVDIVEGVLNKEPIDTKESWGFIHEYFYGLDEYEKSKKDDDDSAVAESRVAEAVLFSNLPPV